MAYDEYVSLASKAKTATALGGASSSAGITKVWGKDVARREWEELIRLGLLIPVVITGSVGDFGMCRCEVSLEECGEVVRREGLEKGVERWCRQL